MVYSEHEDFGFTATDEESMDTTLRKNDIIFELRTMINLFLNKLQMDPDKVMLKWPNRAKEVKNFQDKFNTIADGRKWEGLDN